MKFILTKKSLMVGLSGLALAVSGAVFASQHFHNSSPQGVRDTGGDVLNSAPALHSPNGSTDTSVMVNGAPVSLDPNGAATVNTSSGQANIHVSKDGQNISASTNQSVGPAAPNRQLNVQINSRSSSGASSSMTILNQSGFSQNSNSSQIFSQSTGSINVQH